MEDEQLHSLLEKILHCYYGRNIFTCKTSDLTFILSAILSGLERRDNWADLRGILSSFEEF